MLAGAPDSSVIVGGELPQEVTLRGGFCHQGSQEVLRDPDQLLLEVIIGAARGS